MKTENLAHPYNMFAACFIFYFLPFNLDIVLFQYRKKNAFFCCLFIFSFLFGRYYRVLFRMVLCNTLNNALYIHASPFVFASSYTKSKGNNKNYADFSSSFFAELFLDL